MIYMDQAATSYPTLPSVIKEMIHSMKNYGANPGRGTHTLGVQTSDIVNKTRAKAAKLFNVQHVHQCIFSPSATIALNQAILGYSWKKGDHVIATTMEHNAVRRPLEAARRKHGITVTYIEWTGNLQKFIKQVKSNIRDQTTMFAMTHASNITGDVLPIEEICLFLKKYHITTLVDASQSIGHIPIRMQEAFIDMLVFPGHKGLRGPKGIGMLLVNKELILEPLFYGGSGGASESATPPLQWPYRFEVGTLNVPAIAGLYASFKYIEQHGRKIVSRETKLMEKLEKGLEQIPGVVIYPPYSKDVRVPVLAWNIKDIDSEEIALILDSHYEIAVRAGLHCNPMGHETLHTTEQGVVRVSINETNTEEELDQFLHAVKEIAQSYNI